ncbi:MAG: hypothetical protein KBF71_07640 [Alphaproteobacteria bacterium]|nr:hypothetical protein [Alphaproteobacteria bacterium]
MKSDIVPKSILKSVDNRLAIVHRPDARVKKERHVTFHHDLENRVHEEPPVPETNQLARARQMSRVFKGEILFKEAQKIEAETFDYEGLKEAFDIYYEASELDNLDAMFRMGQILEEGLLFKRSLKNLDIALGYFKELRFALEHPKHDEVMDYIQSIYLSMADMYENGLENTEQDLDKALECYDMVPYRTEHVRQKIIMLSEALAGQILAQNKLDLPDLEKALKLLVDVSHMRPNDMALKDRIKDLKFNIGHECYKGINGKQKLMDSYKYLDDLYAEDPDYRELRELLELVLKQGILPDGYKTEDSDDCLKVFAAVKYFLQFVFKKGDFQEINHDQFMRGLIMNSVKTLLDARPKGTVEVEHKARELWGFILESYFG